MVLVVLVVCSGMLILKKNDLNSTDHQTESGKKLAITVYKLEISQLFMNGILHMVAMFIDSFLLYMTVRFSKDNLTSESVDPLTNKKVPTVVFLQN